MHLILRLKKKQDLEIILERVLSMRVITNCLYFFNVFVERTIAIKKGLLIGLKCVKKPRNLKSLMRYSPYGQKTILQTH